MHLCLAFDYMLVSLAHEYRCSSLLCSVWSYVISEENKEYWMSVIDMYYVHWVIEIE